MPLPRDVTVMGVRELKAEIASLGGQTAGLLEKSELAEALRAARNARAAAAAVGGGEVDADAAGHQCGWAWLCYDTYEQTARLAGSLDARGGGREASLKARLLEVLPLLEQTMEEGSMEDAAAEWLIHGHGWLGERALRRFKVRGQPDALALGRITRWQREDVEAGDGALFHCVHDDGDEEDLEAEEARLSSLVTPP